MITNLVSNDYVPVLRWKAAEVDALSSLNEGIKTYVKSLVELCPSMFIQRKKDKRGNWFEEIRPIEYVSEKLIQLGKATRNLPPLF
jgi:hypothetical protein